MRQDGCQDHPQEISDQGIAVICGSDRCGDRLISFVLHKIFESQKKGFKSFFEKSCEAFLGRSRHETSLHFSVCKF